MKSVQEYIKILEDIETGSGAQGNTIKGPFTAGQLAEIFSKIDPSWPVEMTMNQEYQSEIGEISYGGGSVMIGD